MLQNRLELQWNGLPLSIQQAYEVILKDGVCGVAQYKAYRSLALQGFKAVRCEQFDEAKGPLSKKPRVDRSEEVVSDYKVFSLKNRGRLKPDYELYIK